jgi:hypothetical protein
LRSSVSGSMQNALLKMGSALRHSPTCLIGPQGHRCPARASEDHARGPWRASTWSDNSGALYRATNVVNFAQGDFAMLGAFAMVVLAIDLELPYWLSILITLALLVVHGLFVPFRRSSGKVDLCGGMSIRILSSSAFSSEPSDRLSDFDALEDASDRGHADVRYR